MGLSESPTNLPQKQAAQRCRVGGRVRRHPRTRRCLLKGCEKCYRPRQAWQRYCGAECQEAARAWSGWKAQERYRATEGGREKRRGQCQRYRERVRARRAQRGEAPETAARVIPANFFLATCDRPGCYERFARSRRSPLQRFCSGECRRGLERVWERERRWRESQAGRARRGRPFPRTSRAAGTRSGWGMKR